jgi:flavin-dependent dehydrogenase
VRDTVDQVQHDGAFIIGDAAGLATQDMGEGIGPAIQSGILAAKAILTGTSLTFRAVRKQSFKRHKLALSLVKSFIPPR